MQASGRHGIPTPERALDQPFLCRIENVFSISGARHGGERGAQIPSATHPPAH